MLLNWIKSSLEERSVRVFTAQHSIASLADTDFAIDYQWQPSQDKAIFIIAKKPE